MKEGPKSKNEWTESEKARPSFKQAPSENRNRVRNKHPGKSGIERVKCKPQALNQFLSKGLVVGVCFGIHSWPRATKQSFFLGGLLVDSNADSTGM